MSNQDDIYLIELTAEWRREFVSMAEEHRAAGDDIYRDAIEDFDAYLRLLKNSALGINRPPGRVPAETFCLARDRRILGRSSLRHYLTPDLEHEGGHIGYSIRPSERRKGYGTLILTLTLEKARERGLKRVLLTCDTDNVGSARIIEKNGGVLAGSGISHRSGKPISQYWIELTNSGDA
ncbi:MAG TPA: GNAT family N-acetyltransferase [Pyrinomonadaceae bacterium]|jgi:predicted acetyltransferase